MVEAQNDQTSGRRRESKDFRREQLINATIDALALRGFSATTLADVADRAGLSRGIVNFHFESKEKLLLETLKFINKEYNNHWHSAFQKAKKLTAAQQLRVLVLADLDKKVCNTRLISVWFGFCTEAQSRSEFQKIAWERDEEYLHVLRDLCVSMKSECHYSFDARDTGSAIYALQEGLWLRLMLGGKSFSRKRAETIALTMLGTFFPKHFEASGKIRKLNN